MDAYLDIETTGLSPRSAAITVVGVYFVGTDIASSRVVQIVAPQITGDSLYAALQDATFLYTFNGRRFDLPFIRASIGLDIEALLPHRDLMFDCWSHDLRGGLKAVERTLGIPRRLPDMNGLEAVRLWRRHQGRRDQAALQKLLLYNEEDVVNLHAVRRALGLIPRP